mmetsp:Transcript_24475/g.37773  ORF Transcript_24475/g.37773 Transcript_24475/m.37773 type:complete len:186 (+) Transcript_24475:144-701(+)
MRPAIVKCFEEEIDGGLGKVSPAASVFVMPGRVDGSGARRCQRSSTSSCKAGNGSLMLRPLSTPRTFVCKHYKPGSSFMLCYASFEAGMKRSGIEKGTNENSHPINESYPARDRGPPLVISSSKHVAHCPGYEFKSPPKKKSAHAKICNFDRYPCSLRPLHQPGRLLFEHKHNFYFSENLNHIQH